MKYSLFALFVALLVPRSAEAADGEYHYERAYKAGQKFSYTYERRESMDGNLFRTIRATSNHEVKAAGPVNPSSPPTPKESVTWSSLKQALEPDRLEDNIAVAKQTPALGMNLPANMPPSIPQLPNALGQVVEDLRESYQTFDPARLEKLKKVGDRVSTPARYSTWGNARVGNSGAQCSTEVMELLKLDTEKATFRRQVLPSKDCKEMKFPVAGMSTALLPGTVVGMYFVDRQGAKLTTGWGSYYNTYEVDVSRADGRPLRMEVKSISYSTNRADCDSNFRNCKVPDDGYVDRVSVGERVGTFVLN